MDGLFVSLHQVAGNFHFAPGKSFQQHHVHVHDLQPFSGDKVSIFNFWPSIHEAVIP